MNGEILNSEIIICSGIKMDRNYQHVLNYTKEQMVALCRQHAILSRDDYSFIRKSKNTLEIEGSYDSMLSANYMAFQNKNYSNDWFFAWILDIEYISDLTTRITFEIDVWSSHYQDFHFNPVFVEREHANTDVVGDNLLSEPVSVNNIFPATYVQKRYDSYDICVQATTFYDDEAYKPYITETGNMISACKTEHYPLTEVGLSNLQNFLATLQGDYSTVISLFMFPSDLIGSRTIEEGIIDLPIAHIDSNIQKPTKFGNYTPKNKKLLTYPYTYLAVDNGETVGEYRWELFKENQARFRTYGVVSATPQIALYPFNYNEGEDSASNLLNETEKLTNDRFPQVAFPINSYMAWLAQSSSSLKKSAILGGALSIATGAIGAGISLASGGALAPVAIAGVGAVSGVIASGISYSSAETQAKNMTNKFTGANTGTTDLALGFTGYIFKTMQIPETDAKVIDDFFSMFGYATNRVKVPNLTGRAKWNYVKVNGNCGWGEFNENDIETISNIMNQGVTIWHNHDTLGNYGDMSNPII